MNDSYYVCRECGTMNEFDYVCKACGALNDSDPVCKKCGHDRCEKCETLDEDWLLEERQREIDELII